MVQSEVGDKDIAAQRERTSQSCALSDERMEIVV